MNIIFFTQDDPFYIKIFFDEFFNHFKSHEEIKAIVISRPMGKKSILHLARQMYDFYGLYDFIKMGTRYVLIKAMGIKKIRRSGSESIPKTYNLRQVAEFYGIPVIERSDLNSESCRSLLRQYEPDLFISVASPIIFKEDLIKLPKIDSINIHNAPLPKYRGMLPNFWQLYHGEELAGITIHRIEKGVDTGDIIAQRYVTIDPNDTLHDLIVKTKIEDALMMIEVIEDFRLGMIVYKKQEGEGSYHTFPTREDVLMLKKKNRRLI